MNTTMQSDAASARQAPQTRTNASLSVTSPRTRLLGGAFIAAPLRRSLMRANKTILALVAAGVAVAATVPVTPASAHRGAHRQLAEARAATAQFHNVDNARAAGYLPAEHCVEEPGLGAMGFHNPNLGLMDLAVDHRKPELLLYAPKKNGKTRLVGAEYFVPFVGQPAPELFGQRFDGPMPGHEPGMPTHYDLHVWLWKHNPAGMFAPFNPKVSCKPK